jgi:hypothetical protein
MVRQVYTQISSWNKSFLSEFVSSKHCWPARVLSQDISALGFGAPEISGELKSMSMPMPNIITLPHGKSPPLHLQAPSWRHLLKLMARLSGTRIEPTLEAVAAASGELKLRTVIQFVKVSKGSRSNFATINSYWVW